MSLEGYAVFRKFTDLEQARSVAAELKKADIDCKLVDNSPSVDITFSGNTLGNQIQLYVKQTDFDRADNLLEAQALSDLDHIASDHYLFSFTNEELYEVLLKADEWSSLDQKLAERILTERGQPINADMLKALRKQRLEDLSKPEPSQKAWIYGGYFFSILGGLLGIVIGWHLYSYKKTLPNGQKVYAYSESDRRHGRIMAYIGVFLFPTWFMIRVLTGN